MYKSELYMYTGMKQCWLYYTLPETSESRNTGDLTNVDEAEAVACPQHGQIVCFGTGARPARPTPASCFSEPLSSSSPTLFQCLDVQDSR